MENYIVMAVFLAFIILRGVTKLKAIIFESCLAFQLSYMVGMDIALYYSIQGLLSIAFAHIALRIKTTSASFFAFTMLFQFFLCFSLVPDWGYSLNNMLQFKLQDFNVMMMIILITLGAIDNGTNNRTDDIS